LSETHSHTIHGHDNVIVFLRLGLAAATILSASITTSAATALLTSAVTFRTLRRFGFAQGIRGKWHRYGFA
jgi:hypothetical protein